MGTFAGLNTFGNSFIPDDKKEEFMQKIQKVFYFGGMMQRDFNRFLGKEFVLLDKSCEMDEYGLDFTYNYFEDDFWENAGFSKERCSVYSGKIGWSRFHDVIISAYILEAQYRTGTSYVDCNGDVIWGGENIGWLNYLFKEKNIYNNFDAWNLYAALYKNKDDDYNDNLRIIESTDWYSGTGYGYVSYIEIQCVTYGTDKIFENGNVSEKIKSPKNSEIFEIWFNILICGFKDLEQYAKEDTSPEEQLNVLKSLIHDYYDEKEILLDSISENLKSIYNSLRLTDSPVIIMKKISELYNIDFWELYSCFEDKVHRCDFVDDIWHFSAKNYFITPQTTKDFFNISSYKLIPYWSENSDIELDNEIWDWFEKLKKEYDEIFKSDITISNGLDYIIDLLIYADENYYNIYVFKDFFNETIENLQDRRYLTLWKMFDNMLHNLQFEEWGDVIFVSKEDEENSNKVIFSDRKLKRRLKESFCLMDNKLKNNRARLLLKGYLALISNKELRLKIFGF